MPAVSAETMAANGTDVVSWRQCEVHSRSTFSILSLCLSTLVICVWNAVHPDVPNPSFPRWKVYHTRLNDFLIGLFLPEVLVIKALDQFVEASMFLREMNGAQSEFTIFTISYWAELVKGVYPGVLTMSYWKEAWRPDVSTESTQPRWTMTQAFYTRMRGFQAKSKAGHVAWLTPSDIKALCESDSSKRAVFTANAIEDRSKAGALSKALFCWQLLVFAINCIARRAEHLPLSLLEITTLAHSLCGLAAFALWWYKPHRVDEVVVVPVDDPFMEEIRWRQLDADGESSVVEGRDVVKVVLSCLAAAGLYGLPHLLARSTEFPTLAEMRCWQVAAGIIIGAPGSVVALSWVLHSRFRPFEDIFLILVKGAVIPYFIASGFIVAESFRQLLALPSGTFVSPAFVCYLPHFS